jgi:hypothetical protein
MPFAVLRRRSAVIEFAATVSAMRNEQLVGNPMSDEGGRPPSLGSLCRPSGGCLWSPVAWPAGRRCLAIPQEIPQPQ